MQSCTYGELGDTLTTLVAEDDIEVFLSPIAQKRANGSAVDCGTAEQLASARVAKKLSNPPRQRVEGA